MNVGKIVVSVKKRRAVGIMAADVKKRKGVGVINTMKMNVSVKRKSIWALPGLLALPGLKVYLVEL